MGEQSLDLGEVVAGAVVLFIAPVLYGLNYLVEWIQPIIWGWYGL